MVRICHKAVLFRTSTIRSVKYLSVADPGFSPGGAPTPKIAIIFQNFAKNCMKMKEFGPRGGGGASLAPLLRSANVCGVYCIIEVVVMCCAVRNLQSMDRLSMGAFLTFCVFLTRQHRLQI